MAHHIPLFVADLRSMYRLLVLPLILVNPYQVNANADCLVDPRHSRPFNVSLSLDSIVSLQTLIGTPIHPRFTIHYNC